MKKINLSKMVSFVSLFALLILMFAPKNSSRFEQGAYAQSSGASLRFYGHGTGDIDRVKIPLVTPNNRPINIGDTFTIEFWLKASISENASSSCTEGPDTWTQGNIIIDRDIFGDGDYGDYGISLAGGVIAFGIAQGSNKLTICGSTAVGDSVWHHIAVTRNSSSGIMRIFVDGNLDRQATGPTGNISYRQGRATSYPNDPYLVIGAEKHDYDPVNYPSFSGWIDELRISNVERYTTSFTPPQTPFNPDTNTIALFHFDEANSGPCTGTVNDSAGNPTNGQCRYGGSSPSGPIYTNDVPFSAFSQPAVVSITRLDPNPTNADTVSFRVLFSESVQNVDASDFSVVMTGGLSGSAITGVFGDQAQYTVQVSTGSGSGELRLNVIAGSDIVDADNNSLSNIPFNAGQAYLIDRDPPQVVSITRLNPNPTFQTTVQFGVLFSEPVNGIDIGDFTLSTSGDLVGATIQTISGGPTEYIVQVNTGYRSGNLRLDIVDDDTILDNAGNPLGGVGNNSGFSSGEEYTVNKVELISPANNTELTFNVISFDWADFTGASSYHLQVARTPAFSSKSLILNVTTTNSVYASSKALPSNSILYWRVRARVGSAFTPWSEVWMLTTARPPSKPILLTPLNRSLSTNYQPTFSWRAPVLSQGTTPDYYQIQVDNDGDFSSPEIDQIVNNGTTFVPAAPLNPNTLYYWRVRAFNTDGHYSFWSTRFYFKTAITPPVLVSPDNLQALPNRRPSLDWDDVPNATSYTVQISTDPGFRRALTKTVKVSTFTPQADLFANTTYYWRARANPQSGAFGPSGWSEVRSFTTGNPPSVPVLLLPANNALLSRMYPLLDWSDSTTPPGVTLASYLLQIATDAQFTNIVYTSTPTGSQDSGAILDQGMTYYWRVRSVSAEGHYSAWSKVRSFLTKPQSSGLPGEWTQFAHDAQRTSFYPNSIEPPWRLKWIWNGSNASGGIVSGKFRLPRNSQPVTGNGKVFVAAGTYGIYALNNTNGSVAWNFRRSGALANSTPAYDNDTDSVFCLFSNGILYKLDALNGAILGQVNANSQSNLPLPPAISGDTVFFSMGTKVFAVNKYSLQILWSYDAGSPVQTPPAYSQTANRVVVVSEDLYVHAIDAGNGAQVWRVKPTPNIPGEPLPGPEYRNRAQSKYGWPVIAEQHNIVFVRYRLHWQTIWDWNYPGMNSNSAMRTYLENNPGDQSLFALDLSDGSTAFIPNVGNGGFGDGGYLPMGPMPAIKRFEDNTEVAYLPVRGYPSLLSPPEGRDSREDSRLGELILDDTTVPGFQAGYIRFMQNTYFPTDEQPFVSVAGDQVFAAHWEVGIAHKIEDRSPERGEPGQTPISTSVLPHVVISQDQDICGAGFRRSHYCENGLFNTRPYPGGFYIYWRQGAVYDRYWSEYAQWVISNNMLYFVGTDGSIIALEQGDPISGFSVFAQSADNSFLTGAFSLQSLFVKPAPDIISPDKTWSYIGRNATVQGTLKEVFNNRLAVYLTFNVPHQGHFIVRIPKSAWQNFSESPEKLYSVGQTVQVSGTLTWYQGAPQMIIENPQQIKVISGR
jgi:hypothetical protein